VYEKVELFFIPQTGRRREHAGRSTELHAILETLPHERSGRILHSLSRYPMYAQYESKISRYNHVGLFLMHPPNNPLDLFWFVLVILRNDWTVLLAGFDIVFPACFSISSNPHQRIGCLSVWFFEPSTFRFRVFWLDSTTWRSCNRCNDIRCSVAVCYTRCKWCHKCMIFTNSRPRMIHTKLFLDVRSESEICLRWDIESFIDWRI